MSLGLRLAMAIGALPVLIGVYAALHLAGPAAALTKLAAGRDFGNFWLGGHLAVGALSTPSDLATLLTPTRFQAAMFAAWPFLDHGVHRLFSYPPSYLLLIAPFGAVPSVVAGWLLWLAAGLIALRAALRRAGAWWPGIILLPVVLDQAVVGENGLLLGALSIACLTALDRKAAQTGLWAGLLTVKPQLGLVLPVAFLARRAWRAIAIAALVALALAAGAWLLWPAAWPLWIGRVLPAQAALMNQPFGPTPSQAFMASPFIFFRGLGAAHSLALGLQLAVTATALAVAYAVLRRIDRHRAAGGTIEWRLVTVVLLALGALTAPYALDYDLAALTAMATAGLVQGWLDTRRLRLAALTMIWLPQWNLVAGIVFHTPSIVWLATAAIAAAGVQHLMRQAAPPPAALSVVPTVEEIPC